MMSACNARVAMNQGLRPLFWITRVLSPRGVWAISAMSSCIVSLSVRNLNEAKWIEVVI